MSAAHSPWVTHPIYAKSLEALTGRTTDAGPFASGTIAWLHRIVRIPLWALDDDDVMLLVAHGRDLPFTVPYALDRLAIDPLRSGAQPRGALLLVLTALPAPFWRTDASLLAALVVLLQRALAMDLDAPLRDDVAFALHALTTPDPLP